MANNLVDLIPTIDLRDYYMRAIKPPLFPTGSVEKSIDLGNWPWVTIPMWIFVVYTALGA